MLFMPEDTLIELADRLSGKVVISSDIKASDLCGADAESLIAHITDHFEGREGMKVLGMPELQEILAKIGKKKEPVQIEVVRSGDFKPLAKDVDARYTIRDTPIGRTNNTVGDFTDHFRDRFNKIKAIMKASGNGYGGNVNIGAMNQYISGREMGLIGMVYEKTVTKNGHVMLTLEDESGTAKVLAYKPQTKAKDLSNEVFDTASRVAKDDVLYVKGKVSGPFFIANKILWPDVPIRVRKRTEDDVAIALLSDVHVGSKLFLEKQFGKFLEWLNGGVDNRKDLAAKIKYMVVGGDLVDGVGVYPRQEKELSIDDIYKQYSVFFDFMESIPDYIEVFVLPGNHDAVQRAEPQPAISKKLLGDFARANVHSVANPCYLNLHGVKVLSYHGGVARLGHTEHPGLQLLQRHLGDEGDTEAEAPVLDIRQHRDDAQQERRPGDRRGTGHTPHGPHTQERLRRVPRHGPGEQRHVAGPDVIPDKAGAHPDSGAALGLRDEVRAGVARGLQRLGVPLDIDSYFKLLEEGFQEAYEVASSAKALGFDPKNYVEVKAAPDLAGKVEGLMNVEGLAKLITDNQKGKSRAELAFCLVKEICTNDAFDGYDVIRRIELAVQDRPRDLHRGHPRRAYGRRPGDRALQEPGQLRLHIHILRRPDQERRAGPQWRCRSHSRTTPGSSST